MIPAGRRAAERRSGGDAKNDQQTEHVAEWLEAVRTRGTVSCPPEEAYRSTAAVQLAMIAYKSGGRVDWDGSTEQVRGNPKAAALLKRDYRGPWVHPWKGSADRNGRSRNLGTLFGVRSRPSAPVSARRPTPARGP